MSRSKAATKQERIFNISGNNKGLMCPFKPIVCQGGYCVQCQVFLDWQKLEETVVMCARCGKVIVRKSGSGQPRISHGICLNCWGKYFSKTLRR